jgi:hypothetical protein
MGVFHDINCFGKVGFAERDVYADFLDEASVILDKPALQEAAAEFRRSAATWDALSQALLPANVPLLGEMAQIQLGQRDLLLNQGSAAIDAIKQLKARGKALLVQAETDFPFSEKEVEEFQAGLAEKVMQICAVEETAVSRLRQAMLA